MCTLYSWHRILHMQQIFMFIIVLVVLFCKLYTPVFGYLFSVVKFAFHLSHILLLNFSTLPKTELDYCTVQPWLYLYVVIENFSNCSIIAYFKPN